VLRDGVPNADKAAIKAGRKPDDASRKAPRCCGDADPNGLEFSQCCV
jgi:hypothetical protein